ncbi:MAG: hypothetical protein ACLFUH_00900 [Bacteroidales bacterium]
MDKIIHKLYRKYYGNTIKTDAMTGEKYFISEKGKRVVIDND